MDDPQTRLRQLKEEFDAAHKKGMDGLGAQDYGALSEAIEQERAIIEEQSTLLEALRNESSKGGLSN